MQLAFPVKYSFVFLVFFVLYKSSNSFDSEFAHDLLRLKVFIHSFDAQEGRLNLMLSECRPTLLEENIPADMVKMETKFTSNIEDSVLK
ncbi:hypothetical protein AVEN_139755-1 [Araneus ventricosus]|uniref:Uncharacterized protein n=1 Tax=Araneus ventricosus TaxID=182803 RepID=A0A4Y2KY15_ARAVE|nr:hypothetical protein AVEN_139755-1 [Araneus ventricosus]